jgi:hypothetical protein
LDGHLVETVHVHAHAAIVHAHAADGHVHGHAAAGGCEASRGLLGHQAGGGMPVTCERGGKGEGGGQEQPEDVVSGKESFNRHQGLKWTLEPA